MRMETRTTSAAEMVAKRLEEARRELQAATHEELVRRICAALPVIAAIDCDCCGSAYSAEHAIELLTEASA